MKKFFVFFFIFCLLLPISASAALYGGSWNSNDDSYPELGSWSAGPPSGAELRGDTGQWLFAGGQTSSGPDPTGRT
jgi:hypothetical protein